MKKRFIVILLVASINVNYGQRAWGASTETFNEAKMDIVVYRSPTCGCCSKWIEHIEKQGFNVQDNVLEDMQSIKDKYAVSRSLASCHTAIINGYVVEGHVPARDIITMLKEKPRIKGLAVPGMVVGTPGMEMGDQKAPFKVIAFDEAGQIKLYKAYDKY